MIKKIFVRMERLFGPIFSVKSACLLFLLVAPAVSPAQELDETLSAAAVGRPNLIPQNVILGSYSVRPGDVVTVAWTMTNAGSGHCPASFTGLHLGTSATTPPGSDLLDLLLITPEIPAHTAVRQTNTITIPFSMPLGTYYLWVVADDVDGSTLNQTSRADDFARSAPLGIANVRRQPNLIPRNIALSASMVRPGDQVTVTWSLTNSGNVLCPESLTGLYVSTSATSPATGEVLYIPLETPEIPGNSAIQFTEIITVPPGATLGTYYVWVVADDIEPSTLNQSSRADDVARSSALSVVSVITRPNLVPSNVELSTYTLRPGDQVTVTWTMINSGNANCPASITGLHLGPSATTPPANDSLNLKVATAAINAGASLRQTNVVTIPANVPIGTNYLWVVADDVPNSNLNQSSRDDDAARSAAVAIVTVIRRPNLVPTNIVLGAEFVRPGDQLTVAWTMTNSGNLSCPASKTGLRLGQSATVPPTNGFAMLIDTPAINTNSSVRITNLVTIPANTALGTYYVWVVADDVTNSTLNQSSRADDAAKSSPLGVVSIIPRPNLVPMNIQVSSSSVRPGQQLTLSWTMTNSGTANCPASTTGLHLGTSATTPPTSDVLNLKIATAAINAGGSLRQSNVVTVPTTMAPGTYYFWVVADDVANSTLNQSSRADDAAHSGAVAIAKATLVSPEAGETIGAPPTFTWSATGIANAKVYLAAKPAPVLGVDTVVFFDNPNGTNSFKPTSSNWITAVNALGFAANYYWTVGSASTTQREIYAEWRAFKSIPMVSGGGMVAGSGGEYRFQVVAPNQSPVVLQASENLTNDWVDIGSVQNSTGTINYTDPTASTRTKRFYRARP